MQCYFDNSGEKPHGIAQYCSTSQGQGCQFMRWGGNTKQGMQGGLDILIPLQTLKLKI